MTTTPFKNLTQPVVSGDIDVWGGELNTDISLLDTTLGGTITVTVTSTTTTLTTGQIQNSGFRFNGTLTTNSRVFWPSFYGFAAVQNTTSGSYTLSCGISGGTPTILQSGETVSIWSDGTNFLRLAAAGAGVLSNNAVDLYAIGGQSNALGTSADATFSPAIPLGYAYQYYSGTLSLVSGDPIGAAVYSSAWPEFAITYVNATGRRLLFVPMAVGGTDQTYQTGGSPLNWDTPANGGTLAPALTGAVALAMTAAVSAGLYPRYMGILWSQGENDGGTISNNVSLPAAGVATITGGPYPAGTTVITVADATGLAASQYAIVTLSPSGTYTTAIVSVSGTTVTLTSGAPATIPNGGGVTPYSKAFYENGFMRMADYFRTTPINGVTYSTLPIYISQTGGNGIAGDSLGMQRVRTAQDEIAQKDPYTKIVFRGAVDFITRRMMQGNISFTGGISGTTLTVTSIVSGLSTTTKLFPATVIAGSGVTANTTIVSGTGGIGTFIVSPSQTVASGTAMTTSISDLHYTQAGYNEMGREMAKGIVAAQQSEPWLHQNYNVYNINLGGTLTVADVLTIVVTSSGGITPSPWTITTAVAATGAVGWTALGATVRDNSTIYSPPLQAVGINVSYTTNATGAVITYYQPISLYPQATITATWSGARTENAYIIHDTSPYGWSPNLYYDKGSITIGSASQGPDLFSVVSTNYPVVTGTNVFPAGIFQTRAAGADNNLLRLANTITTDALDTRVGLLFQPAYNLYTEFNALYGGAIIAKSDSDTGRAEITVGGYAANVWAETARFTHRGGFAVGVTGDPGAGNVTILGFVSGGTVVTTGAVFIGSTLTVTGAATILGAATALSLQLGGSTTLNGSSFSVWNSGGGGIANFGFNSNLGLRLYQSTAGGPAWITNMSGSGTASLIINASGAIGVTTLGISVFPSNGVSIGTSTDPGASNFTVAGSATIAGIPIPNAVGLFSTSITVNFGVAGDNAITVALPIGFTRFGAPSFYLSNATADLSTATFGVFTGTGGGGVAIQASGTAITVTTSAANTLNNALLTTPATTTVYTTGSIQYRVNATAAGSGRITFFYRALP